MNSPLNHSQGTQPIQSAWDAQFQINLATAHISPLLDSENGQTSTGDIETMEQIAQRQISSLQHGKGADMAHTKIDVRHLDFFYGSKQALFDVSMPFRNRQVTALIGPSGCGKSTFLRTLNRMNDLIPQTRTAGEAIFDGENIYDSKTDVVLLRQRIGMVFQRPNPFPKSVFENVAYGLRVQGRPKKEIVERVEKSLRGAALWDEVKDRLHRPATGLSGGQQQRLCIARALAVRPEVLLMDEPCSALDPISTLKVEELITELVKDYTIVIVTHNMQQAARVSQFTGFFLHGKLVEHAPTVDIFKRPKKKETEDYISGRFG